MMIRIKSLYVSREIRNPTITDTITVSEQPLRDVITIRIRKRKASEKLFREMCPIC